MAILGNLRKNSFVLIAVIGMALFAFVIAGVFDGSGFQSPDPIGKVNGEELSITDFRNQMDVLKKSGCRHFYVARLEDAINLRKKHKDNIDLYLLSGATSNETCKLLKKYKITPRILQRQF